MAGKKEKKKQGGDKKRFHFFVDMKTELKRVNWPSKQQLLRNTAAVLVISIAFAVLIWVVDMLVYGGLRALGLHNALVENPAANRRPPAATQVIPQATTQPEGK